MCPVEGRAGVVDAALVQVEAGELQWCRRKCNLGPRIVVLQIEHEPREAYRRARRESGKRATEQMSLRAGSLAGGETPQRTVPTKEKREWDSIV